LPEFFTSHHEKIQIELQRIINRSPLALYSMLRYHMGWQDEHGHPQYDKLGKFARSTLCLLSCEAVGGNAVQIVPAAAALELVHNFSLLHDDIEDASGQRRKKPTVWKLWGQSQAINAGDAMFSLVYLALLRLRENGIADRQIIHSYQILSETCIELCEGQYLDLAYEDHFSVTVEDYLGMIAKKTAALIAASSSLGAYLGTEDEEIVNRFRQFGKELGLAYQIRDDILGIWGIEESTGKSVESDISQRKKTLPVIYGLQNSKSADREMLEKLYSQESIKGDDLVKVLGILNQSVARDYAQRLAEQYHHRALAQLEATGLAVSRQAPLRQTARFLIEREY